MLHGGAAVRGSASPSCSAHLVDDDVRRVAEAALRKAAQQDACRREEQRRARVRALLATDLVPDSTAGRAERLAALCGDARRDADGCDAARLRHDDARPAAGAPRDGVLEDKLGDLQWGGGRGSLSKAQVDLAPGAQPGNSPSQ